MSESPCREDLSSYDKRGYLTDDLRLFHLTDVGRQEFAFHYHDFDKIIIFLSGRVTYLIEGRSYELVPYDIVLVNHNEIHRPLIDMAVPYERVIVYLSPDFLAGYRTADCDLERCFAQMRDGGSHVLRMGTRTRRPLASSIRHLEDACRDRDYGAELNRRVRFLEFMIELNRAAADREFTDPVTVTADGRILELMEYINRNLADRLSIDDLAARAHFSRYHLMRLFKRETGCSIGDYIRSKRLLAARELLGQGLTVTEACYRCGFRDYSAFSRAYRAEFGTCAREYTRGNAETGAAMED